MSKILILTKKFPYPLKDGEAIAIFNNIKGFSRLGHEVTVLAINTLKHHYDITQLPDDVKRRLFGRQCSVGARLTSGL